MRVPNPFRVTPSMACLAATFLASSFMPALTSGSGLGAQIELIMSAYLSRLASEGICK